MNIFLRFVASLVAGFVVVATMVAIRKLTGFHSDALTGAVGTLAFMLTWGFAKSTS